MTVDTKFNRNISILLIILFLFAFACSDVKEHAQTPVSEKPSVSKKQYVKYGINCEDLILTKDTIQPHQNLSDILSKYMVPGDVIHAVAFSSKSVFDVRTIKAGNSFCIIRDNNPVQKVRYFVYEINPEDYVVFKLEDPATTSLGKKPVRIEIETVSESIESSLWETLTEKEIDTELAVKLSEIYAWTIDFHHLQKGDGFQAIYEKKFIKDKFIGLGKIWAARFYHQNVFFYAFYF